ncbi:MAG TPA: SPFH domain-containing protein [Burkholderiales bacterium]|nr:SPFH domain-containing protein [Burkholderiales bacterium]
MRNYLIILLAVLFAASSGFFVVDQREVGIIKQNSKQLQIYAPGLHWKIPFWGELTFIYTNLRSSYLASSQLLHTATGQAFSTNVVVNWQVVKPEVYFVYLNANDVKNLDVQIVSVVSNRLLNLANKSSSLSDFEERVNSQLKNIPESELGINFVNVGLAMVNPVIESAVPIGDLKTMSSESAFSLAQQIKQQADKNQQQIQEKLREKNSKFYDYFMKIYNLSNNAESRSEIPPLNELYTN